MKRPFNRKKLGPTQLEMLGLCVPEYPHEASGKDLRTLYSLDDRGLVSCVHGVWRITFEGQRVLNEAEGRAA